MEFSFSEASQYLKLMLGFTYLFNLKKYTSKSDSVLFTALLLLMLTQQRFDFSMK